MSSSRSGQSPFDAVAAAAQVRAASLLGRVLADRYRIDEVLAMGGMGAVYRGQHVHMHKRVAIKVLHPETENFPDLVARFEREAVVGAHVAHANVAAASDFGRLDDGSCYLVLEYVDGITLHQLIKQGPVPVGRAVDIARQLGDALDAIHQLDIVHRDLKPRNVMVAAGKHDVVKLIDFGLASVPLERFAPGAEATKITGMGVVFGTPGYMAPEIALGMEHVTASADLYAYGVILYEMLTGKHPFEASSSGPLFVQHRTQPPPPFRERAPGVDVPPEIEAVVMRLLAKAPSQRYGGAMEAVLALGLPPLSERTPPASADANEPTPGPAQVSTPAPGAARKASLLPWVVTGACALAIAALVARSTLFSPAESPAPTAAASAQAAPSVAPVESALAPSASAGAPVASASSARVGDTVDGLDAQKWRGVLRQAAEVKQWHRGAEAVLALAELDPASFGQPDLLMAAAGAAVGIELGDRTVADRVYETLGRLGARGVDILYEMTSRYGGSKGARRALELLRRPEVASQATPAAQIAIALRDAPCDAKAPLYERAAADGDERTLALVWAMRSPSCTPKTGECCIKNDPALEDVVKALRTRLKR